MATLGETGNICLLGILINHLFIIITYSLIRSLVLGMLFEYLYSNLCQKDFFNPVSDSKNPKKQTPESIIVFPMKQLPQ